MKSDKEKLFEAFEKICKVKINESSQDNNLLEENWKNWAIALGIVGSSFFVNDVNAQVNLNLKNKIENVKSNLKSKISKDPVLKQLEKDGYSPAIGDRINPDKNLIDNNIEVVSNTMTNTKFQLIETLKLKNMKYDRFNGIIVYKEIPGNKIKAKWISYK